MRNTQEKVFNNNDNNDSSSSIIFNMTGTTDIEFQPIHAPNVQSCGGPNTKCNLGIKPFVVAGGRMDVVSFPDADDSTDSGCKTHTKILDKVYRDHVPEDVNAFPTYTSFPDTCQSQYSDTEFVRYDFNTNEPDGYGNFTGNVS